MKAHTVQTSFIAGTLDQQARARSDTALYRNGAASLRNCLLLSAGGAISRWGSRYLGTLAGVPRMHEFSFSLDQSYVAVFLNGAVSFFFASDGVPAGTLVGTPWTWADLPALSVTQGGDFMWVAHENYPTQLIRRVGAASWVLETLNFDGVQGTPFFRYERSSVTAVWDSGTGLVTFSSAWPFASGMAFRMWDVTAKIYRYGTMGSPASATEVPVSWETPAPPSGAATRLWFEPAFSVARGYARTVCLHQQRLVMGGTRSAGDAVFLSAAGQYWNFDLGTALDGDAISFSLGSSGVQRIVHTISGPQLTFFTERGVFYVPEQETRPLTPASIRWRMAAPHGANNARPGAFDGGVIFPQSEAQVVRDVAYNLQNQNVSSEAISLPATDILGTVVDAAYMPSAPNRPEQYAFFVNSAGNIALFHSIREQRVAAWAEWTTQGAYRAVGVAGRSVFVAVERWGAFFLERFDPALAFDCGIQDTTPDLAIPHLVGVQVHGRSGNNYLGPGTTGAGGAVTLESQTPEAGGVDSGIVVELGLAFDWWIDPLPPVFDLPDGTLAQRTQRILETHVNLYRARSARVSANALTLLVDGLDASAAPASRDGWWMTRHLGFARPNEPAPLTRRIDRDVPMPTGVLSLKRLLQVL